MGKILKYLFYFYVIALSTYVTFKQVMSFRWHHQKIVYQKPQQKCFEGGRDWRFCIHTTSTSDPRSLLYVFHGKDQNENLWMKGDNYAALLQKYWQEKGKKIPTVVTLSFGPIWLLTQKTSQQGSGLLDRMQGEVFYRIEKQLGRPQRRYLLGNSMGGLNVLTLAMTMTQHFSKVAALCPPIFPFTPHDSWQKVMAFALDSGAKPKSAVTAVVLGRRYFANNQEWAAFDPLKKSKQVHFSQHQSFYITAGLADRFGLYKGVRTFVKNLQQAGARTLWRPNSGDHCAVDIVSLGEYFSL